MSSTAGGKAMPVAYAELLAETQPEVIATDEQYQEALNRVGILARKGKSRTADETKLMRLLSVLIEDYDRRHTQLNDDGAAHERLRHLLEVSGKTPADLLPIFGQRSHVNEALNGKRPINATHAR